MTVNLTKNKITINSIINFVHEAMHHNMNIIATSDKIHYAISIDKEEDTIKFYITEKFINISALWNGSLHIDDINLTKRDVIDLETLMEDIKEYRENRIMSFFNNFYSNLEEKPTNIDDLDNDDE